MADSGPITDPEADLEILDDEPRNLILGIISQVRKGMDLHRIALPTFILEPRSMLERLTDFMAHPDFLLLASREEDSYERFLLVLKYFLSGWHIRPKGVKKPYNPALSEFFRCQWRINDPKEPSVQHEAFYVAEQVSHHPPISSFYYTIPECNIEISGAINPKSRFLGNSAASIMVGETKLSLLDHPGEEYVFTNPNVYARGILFGTMMMELGDSCSVKCAKTGYSCDIDFMTKGFFGGTYNSIKGKIKNSKGEILSYISGKWTDVMYIQNNTKSTSSPLLDASNLPLCQKMVYPEEAQEEYESRRLWSKVTSALLAKDMNTATTEKNIIEDKQRKIKHDSKTDHDIYEGRFFKKVDAHKPDEWICVLEKEREKIKDSKLYKEKVMELIFNNPPSPVIHSSQVK